MGGGRAALAARALLAEGIMKVLENPTIATVAEIRKLLQASRDEGIEIRLSVPARHFDRRLQDLMSSIWTHARRTDAAALILLLDLAEDARLPVSKAPLENLAWRLRAEKLHPALRKPALPDDVRKDAVVWVDVLERLNFDMDLEREILGLPAPDGSGRAKAVGA